jgi:uncharacterized protein YoxC
MAEVDVGGVKFKGGKLVIVFTLLSTLGGGLWAGFEFYKDYMDMREKIESYTAPDLSGFDKKIALLRKTMKEVRREMNAVRIRVGEIQTVARDIREDTRADAGKLFGGISAVDKRSRTLDSETRSIVRSVETRVRNITSKNEKNIRDAIESAATRMDTKINSANSRFDTKISQVDSKLDALEKRLGKQLRRALDNPLLKRK